MDRVLLVVQLNIDERIGIRSCFEFAIQILRIVFKEGNGFCPLITVPVSVISTQFPSRFA